MAFYDEMADVTLELITEFGQTLVLAVRTAGEFDSVEGRNYDSTETTHNIQAVRVPVNQTVVDQLELKYGGQSLVASQVILLKVAAKDLAVVPALGHTITLDGIKYPVVSSTPVNPAGTPLVYTTALKK